MSKTLQRRALLAAGLGAATLTSPARAQQGALELRWRLSSAYARNLDILFGASESLAKAVAEATDGRFQIQVSAAGEAAPADGLLDAVGAAKVEMGHAPASVGMAKNSAFALATAMPFGLNARGQNAWWLQGGA